MLLFSLLLLFVNNLLFSIKQTNCHVKKTTKFTCKDLTSFFLSFIIRMTMWRVSLYIEFVLWERILKGALYEEQ